MARGGFPDLRSFLRELHKRGDLFEIQAPVTAKLELPEIHRRVISEEGPALLFRNVDGSAYPVATNLFGTKERVDLAFGTEGRAFIEEVANLPHDLMPPSISKLWGKKKLFSKLLKVGLANTPASFKIHRPANLDALPILTSWPEDGGPFVTLPLVYTEEPGTGMHNLGMYRMHKYDAETTGMHFQIGKGGGFHLAKAKEMNQKLPVNVFLGGPPAGILAAIAPLPENVPELLLGSLLLGKKLGLTKTNFSPLPVLSGAEFALLGTVDPVERLPEGPFGDHYGYYSLQHDFPVFRLSSILARPDAIYPATIVGKPRQEDYYIGNYLQELLSPLFPVVMPAVRDLWSYGETGYHSLAAAVVKERYKREAMASAFRILGEGQLSLTKFLLLVDREMDLKDFTSVLEYVLQRADFRSDLYLLSNLAMDTLDYTGPKLNEGSKGVLLGMGDPIRELPGNFIGELPQGISKAEVFCRGCLVVSGTGYKDEPGLAKRLTTWEAFSSWPLVVLADSADCAKSEAMFLWTTFTRFEPAGDVFAKHTELIRYHASMTPPIIIDARMKPQYPGTVECDEETSRLVDKRWDQYFRTN